MSINNFFAKKCGKIMVITSDVEMHECTFPNPPSLFAINNFFFLCTILKNTLTMGKKIYHTL